MPIDQNLSYTHTAQCRVDATRQGRARLSGSRYLSSGRGGGCRGLDGLLGCLVGGGSLGDRSLTLSGSTFRGVVLLAGGVDRDLNGDLTALDLLAVHLGASLLLELFGTKGDETEATALAGLTASLELLDHETGDWAEGDLGLGGGVVLEDLEKLGQVSDALEDSRLINVPYPPSGRMAGSQP